jgi:hypothetical protein
MNWREGSVQSISNDPYEEFGQSKAEEQLRIENHRPKC